MVFLALIALLVLAALVAVFAIPPEDQSAVAAPAAVAEEGEPAPEVPVAVVARPPVEGPRPAGARESVAVPEAERTETPARASLRVFLTDERGAPFPDVRLHLAVMGSRLVPRNEEQVATDGAGRAELEAPPGRELELRAEWGARRRWKAVVAPLAEGEERELRFELPDVLRLAFYGRVVADEGGAPIAGARVQERSEGEHVLASTISAPDGGFQIVRERPGTREYLRVEAPGFAPALASFGKGHESPLQAFTVRLARAAGVQVCVLDDRGAAPDVTVRLRVPAYRLAQSEASMGFPSTGDVDWTADTGPEGCCEIGGLPPEVPLDLELLRGRESLRRLHEPLQLAPGERREISMHLGDRTRLRGLLLDQDGLAVSGQEVWLLPATRDEAARYFSASDEDELVARAESDGTGRFEIPDVPPGAWWLGPAAEREPSAESVAPVGTRIEIPPGSAVWDVTLTTARGLYISGRVVQDGPGEVPVQRASVFGYSGFVVAFHTGSGPDGSFRLGPLTEGTWQLIARELKGERSEPVEARAGEEGIVLRIIAGGWLKAEAIDPRTNELIAAQFEFAKEGDGVWMSGGSGDGRFESDRLRPGLCDLVARTEDGRIGVAARIRIVAGETVSIRIPVAPAGRLIVRLRAPGRDSEEGRVQVVVLQDGAQVAFRTPGMLSGPVLVPNGNLAVELRSWNRETAAPRILEVQWVQVAPGEEREVHLGGG
jgi:hypothetical protein